MAKGLCLQYNEDEMLQLSGIQHYVFCPRQWALIYIEQEWIENHLTAEGRLLHENVDNPFQRERNGSSVFTLRGIKLESRRLGFYGIADAVEVHPVSDLAYSKQSSKQEILQNKNYTIIPVEYKRGKRKISDCDRMQVTLQAMILEEMLNIKINKGAIFYWTERHREYFEIDDNLRSKVIEFSKEMHNLFSSKSLPHASWQKSCKSCSVYDVCMPELSNKRVSKYLNFYLNEETS